MYGGWGLCDDTIETFSVGTETGTDDEVPGSTISAYLQNVLYSLL